MSLRRDNRGIIGCRNGVVNLSDSEWIGFSVKVVIVKMREN